MTERQLYAFNRLGHLWLSHPELKSKNLNILKDYNIIIDNCKTGPGFDELGKFDLRDNLEIIKQMGLMDEIENDKENALEIIRAASMKLNYNLSKETKYTKGVV